MNNRWLQIAGMVLPGLGLAAFVSIGMAGTIVDVFDLSWPRATVVSISILAICWAIMMLLGPTQSKSPSKGNQSE